MDRINLLKKLTAAPGLSAAESGIAAVLQSELERLGLKAHIDSFGNVHAMMPSAHPNAKTLLLEAHMDQIGFMVSSVTEEGLIRFDNLGGVDERILPGMEVEILSAPPIYGVIGALPARGEKEKKNPKLSEYAIDTGLCAKEAKDRIRPGCWVRMLHSMTPLQCGRYSDAAMDNRAGVTAILECIESLRGARLPYHIAVLFSTQEELGLHGAYTGVIPGSVDAAIAVDVTHGTTPDTKDEVGVFPLGSGAVICRGPNLHYDYTKQLLALAKSSGIPHAIEVASGGSGTTAWAIQTVGGGIPVMLVSIPLRYMHTNVETLDQADMGAVAALLAAAARGGIELA